MDILEELRTQIDAIDNELLAMLAKRQAVVKEVGEYKIKHNLPIFDARREKYLHEFHKQLSIKYNLSLSFIKELSILIMTESKRTQRSKE
ncbi:MAG: chorismate mutase [Burkholderiales bacterium]|nr:chorismate mutase [Burkholderiales bacterium]